MKIQLILSGLLASAALCAIPGMARAQIFETNTNGDGTIGEYTTSGATVNASLVSSGLQSPEGIAVSGGNLFVVSHVSGAIGEFTTSGATVNASLVLGLGALRASRSQEGICLSRTSPPTRLANTQPLERR